MAFRRICLLLVFLSFVCAIRCDEYERGRYGEGDRERRNNPYIFKRENTEMRLATEQGEIHAVPIFRESSSIVRDLRNYELNWIRIRPNSFMLPHYSNGRRYLFIQEGTARVGFVSRGKLREEELKRGKLHFVPMGAIFYVINTDRSQTLVLLNLLHNPNSYRERHHDSFYVGGGRDPPTVLSAFSQETLVAALKTDSQRIERLFSRQQNGVFASFSEHQRNQTMNGDAADNKFSVWSWASKHRESKDDDYKAIDLEHKSPSFSNNYGQFTVVDGEEFSPLERHDMAITYTKIKPNGMKLIHLNTNAAKIGVVVRGQGRIEIASPEGVREEMRRSGRGRGEGDEDEDGEGERGRGRGEGDERGRGRGEGEGEFRVSYERVDDELRAGDVFVIPAGHPSVEISSSNQNFEILSFLINFENNRLHFLAGKNSLVREMRDELLAASFNERQDEVKRVFESQNEEIFARGPQNVREWNIL